MVEYTHSEMWEILDNMTYNQKLDRLKNLYDDDEICEILDMNEDEYTSMDKIYRIAVDNGNFIESIVYNTKLPI